MLSIELLELINYENVKDISSKDYLKSDEYAYKMFDTKYCTKWDENGIVVTDNTLPYFKIETPADVFWRVSSSLASMEATKELQDLYSKHWFALMWLGWFRPGGSVLAGVGAPVVKSLLNCTTLPLSEDSLEGINKLDYDIMKCAAFRQGLGFDGSILRPRGAKVNNAAEESTGAVPWIMKLVDNGEYVGQKGRKPAILVSLKDHHPDIVEFICSKSEKGILENANISVQISNAFIDAVEKDADWELYYEFKEGSKYSRISKTIKAKYLFNLIAEKAFATAEPGVQYIDLLREGSMVHQIYLATGDERFMIISTNACSEKSLPPYGVCNLLSPNHAMFSINQEEYLQELAFIVPYLVRISDNVVAYELHNNLSPLEKQRWILEQTREVGLGITNIHGWLLGQDIAYDSDEAIEKVGHFFKHYAYNVFKASMDLGKEKGNAPAFDMVTDKKSFMGSSYFSNIVNEFFDGDYTKVLYMRNMAHMSVAPTGSLSGTFPIPCFSYGVEPFTGSYWWRRTRAIDKSKYTHYFMIPNKIKEYVLSKLDTSSLEYEKLSAFPGSVFDDDGVIGLELSKIIDGTLPKGFFKPAHYIDPMQKVRLMGAMYKWVDAAISCTYNLPPTATAKDVENIYMEAYKHGVRAVSVYVEGSREGILIFEDPKTNAALFEKKQAGSCDPSERPLGIVPNCAPKRPAELPCDIFYTSIKGEMWTVLIGLLDGKPYEVFCGTSEDLYLPKNCNNGIIRKQGKGTYELDVIIRRSPVVYKDLASILMTDGQKGMTRLLSLALRHGALPKYIVEQLKKTNGSISDFSTAISRVLSKYVDAYVLSGEDNKCPLCGESSLVNSEGCIKCVNEGCNYSRCS
jgi:ribonucleoside-diphosphate reductase alpha chain